LNVESFSAPVFSLNKLPYISPKPLLHLISCAPIAKIIASTVFQQIFIQSKIRALCSILYQKPYQYRILGQNLCLKIEKNYFVNCQKPIHLFLLFN